jgi:hypothetical protein
MIIPFKDQRSPRYMAQLTPTERRFFSLVHQAVYANPFSDDRQRVDLEIAGFFPNAQDGSGLDAVMGLVRQHVDGLAADGRADITRYPKKDGDLVTSALLFDLFHRYTDHFDRLIAEQIEAGERSVPVPFATDILGRLARWGIAPKTALRFLSLCYQLRRAYYFIDRHLKGCSDSMHRLRESLWNNVFTRDMDLYQRYLWNRMEDFSTLLLGETGSGKGTAAMAIGRSGYIPFDEKTGCFRESFTRSFIAINLSQYPQALIESELFGHRKGAFTGAVDDFEGVFQRCSPHGAIFLDEIGEVAEPIQIKLLQVIQERIFHRVGDHRDVAFRGRVIAATNLPADQLLGKKAMREDFFYRLCSDLIVVPPLAQRLQETPEELKELLKVVVERIVGLPSAELVELVEKRIHQHPGIAYTWPGNVRELEQCVRRILLNRTYTPLTASPATHIGDVLKAGIDNQHLTIKHLVEGYCVMLYQKHRTIEAVARIAGIDRRTAKKHIHDGRRRFASDPMHLPS